MLVAIWFLFWIFVVILLHQRASNKAYKKAMEIYKEAWETEQSLRMSNDFDDLTYQYKENRRRHRDVTPKLKVLDGGRK